MQAMGQADAMMGDPKTDREFLAGMIVHHQAAVTMSRAYLANTKPATRQARVVELARAIIAAQTTEIATMKAWLSTIKT